MLYIADDNDYGKRLDTRLTEVLDNFSRSQIQDGIKEGKILVNGARKKSSYKLKEDDEICISDIIKEPKLIKAENIPLDIVYEDDNIAVINKPSGMLTQPTENETKGTLVNALMYMYKDNLSDVNGMYRRGIVHRLDRNTSGLLIIAKNNPAHNFIANEIKTHQIEKHYRAIVKGIWKNDEDVIDLPIGRNPKQPHKMAVIPGGKESRTILKVIKRYKDATAVELNLITGRTHQIRVHLSYMGHPIYNDTLYGAGKGKVITQEQVLQSFFIKFTKPFSGEIIELEIPPDEKYSKVQRYLEGEK